MVQPRLPISIPISTVTCYCQNISFCACMCVYTGVCATVFQYPHLPVAASAAVTKQSGCHARNIHCTDIHIPHSDYVYKKVTGAMRSTLIYMTVRYLLCPETLKELKKN